MSTLTTKRPGARKPVTPFLRSAVLAVAWIASFTGVLRAQSSRAPLADRVSGPNEAVIVGARVARHFHRYKFPS